MLMFIKTWITIIASAVAIGAVQLQDPYGKKSPDAWYARHQQVEWELVLAGRPPVSVFTHHPDKSEVHAYWTGDNLCECGSFFQNGPAVVGVYRIPAKQLLQHIHAHLPRKQLDEVVQQDGWVFFRHGEVYGGLWAANGWRWTTEGEFAEREMISGGVVNAIVCQAGKAEEFGTFQSFQQRLSAATIRFDPQAVSLEYASPGHGKLRVDADGGRFLNDQPTELDYPTWDSPYVIIPTLSLRYHHSAITDVTMLSPSNTTRVRTPRERPDPISML